MAQGLFASLLIGTIIKTVGQQTGLALLVDLGGQYGKHDGDWWYKQAAYYMPYVLGE